MHRSFFIWLLVSQLITGGAYGINYTVTFIKDGPTADPFIFEQAIPPETERLLDPEMTIDWRFLEGDWTYATAKKLVDEVLNDSETDLLITIGVLSSDALLQRRDHKKLSLASLSIDERQLPALPSSDPFWDKLAFVGEQRDLTKELDYFGSLVPYKSLALIGDSSLFSEGFSFVRDYLQTPLAAKGIEVHFIPVKDSVEEALTLIDEQAVDAAVLLPAWQITRPQFKELIEGINERGIASYSYSGETWVQWGALLASVTEKRFRQWTRRIALSIQVMLLEQSAQNVARDLVPEQTITINTDTAKRLNIELSYDLITLSQVVSTDTTNYPMLTLLEAMQRAVSLNPALLATSKELCRNEALVESNLALLRPQLTGSIDGRWIESDRASRLIPERLAMAKVIAEQVIYDETLSANLQSQRQIAKSSLFDLQAARQNLLLETTDAYINVLRQQAFARSIHQNLQTTHSNLKRAEARVSAGQASKAEVYRWQTEMAQSQQDLLNILQDIDDAKTLLNKLLDVGSHCQFSLESLSVDHELFEDFHQFVEAHLTKADRFNRLAEQLEEEAVCRSPEVVALEASIAAQERQVTAKERAYYVPTITSSAAAAKTIHRGGRGKPRLDGQDDMEYALILDLKIPLYTSGKRHADRSEAMHALCQLVLEKEDLQNSLVKEAHDALRAVRTSYYAIKNATDAVLAARQNLRIVTESYERGVIAIVDLIDAQTSALNAEQAHATAILDYLATHFRLQRSISWFTIDRFPNEVKEWMDYIENLFNKKESGSCSVPLSSV